MKRKVIVVLFFIVVFALPLVWYLFLQLFGENKFDLPKIRKWDQNCLELRDASLLVDSAAFASYPNQLRRIEMRMSKQKSIELVGFSADGCGEVHDFFLVDREGWIRGEFDVSREEVDRLMAEIDIYVLNEFGNKPN